MNGAPVRRMSKEPVSSSSVLNENNASSSQTPKSKEHSRKSCSSPNACLGGASTLHGSTVTPTAENELEMQPPCNWANPPPFRVKRAPARVLVCQFPHQAVS